MGHTAPYDKSSPAWHIIEYLQRNHTATIKDLEAVLGITTTAVRQHLQALQADGHVDRSAVNSGVGRPHHVYVMTDTAYNLFECHCDDLALTMLEEMFEMVGPDRISVLLEKVSNRLASRYTDGITASALQSRVEQMAAMLDKNGVLTDVMADDDGTIVLRTYNCPYHDLAQEHREICDIDQDMMRKVLGTDVALGECIMDGDGGCSFVVTSQTSDQAEVVRDTGDVA